MGVCFNEAHNLLSCDPLLECLLETLSCEHAHHQVLEHTVLPHEQSQDGPVQLRVSVCVHLEVALYYDELALLGSVFAP